MTAFYPAVFHIHGEVGDTGQPIPHKGVAIVEESTQTVRFVLTEDFSLIAVGSPSSLIEGVEVHPEAGALIYNTDIFPRIIGTPV